MGKPNTDNVKLFDQFFKLNNSKSDSDILRDSTQMNQRSYNYQDEDDFEPQRSILFSGDFLKFLDHSITYLHKSEGDYKSLPSKF